MPRLLHEKILASETLSELSEGAQSLWWRLIAAADNFGRFPAAASEIVLLCYRSNRYKEITVAAYMVEEATKWLREMELVGAVEIYEVDGRKYGRFVNWREYQRVTRKTLGLYPPSPSEPAARGPAKGKSPQAPKVLHPVCKLDFETWTFKIDPALLDRWDKTFVYVDPKQCIKKAEEWVQRKWPASRKKDWEGFLVKWISRDDMKVMESGAKPRHGHEVPKKLPDHVQRWVDSAKKQYQKEEEGW